MTIDKCCGLRGDQDSFVLFGLVILCCFTVFPSFVSNRTVRGSYVAIISVFFLAFLRLFAAFYDVIIVALSCVCVCCDSSV